MGKKLKKAPVYFTIAQVRHNPVLQLRTFVPSIQERLRKAGYPDHQPSRTLVLNLSPGMSDAAADSQRQMPQTTDRHDFLSMDGTSGFIVEEGGVSFQTTEYDTFPVFARQLFVGLQIVHDCIGLAYSERIGLRYLDAVVPSGGAAELSKYLAPGVLGLAGRLPEGVSIGLSLSETHIPLPDASLVSRTIIRDGPLGFPMDLEPRGLRVPARFQQVSGVHAIIDTDASQNDRQPMNIGKLRERFNSLHSRIRMAFEASVTDHAMKSWE